MRFSEKLHPAEIPAFRGAVANKIGWQHDIFHNHTEEGRQINRYPLMQYKSIGGKAGIFCMGEGVDEIHHFFNQGTWKIQLSGRELNLEILNLELKQHTFQVWDKLFEYQIDNWLALNDKNYEEYTKLKFATEKIEMLENVMKGNMLSMAKSIGWTIEKDIRMKIADIGTPKFLPLKGVKLMAFSLPFYTNMSLPRNLGLGKGVSHGFGSIKNQKKSDINEPRKASEHAE